MAQCLVFIVLELLMNFEIEAIKTILSWICCCLVSKSEMLQDWSNLNHNIKCS